MENTVFWFIGANATGKSTLAAAIQKALREREGARYSNHDFDFIRENGKVLLTITSAKSCNLGNFCHPLLYDDRKTNACCGTDTLPKKELVARALEVASYTPNNVPLIFVEGIMATRQWLDLMPKGYRVHVVLFDIDLDYCMHRIIQRRAKKTGKSEEELIDALDQKTVDNVNGKITGFRKMYYDLLRRDIVTGTRLVITSEFILEKAVRHFINSLYGKV